MTKKVLLELRGVTRRYGAETTSAVAVDGVDLKICEGEFVVITGPSGSGKSTLLNILGLLDKPDSGEYAIEGRSCAELSGAELDRLRGVEFGFIFQESYGVDARTVQENVELPLMLRGLASAERRRLALDAIAKVGLSKRKAHAVMNLSGGERQRMAIARAIASQPKVLLVDEPTGSLDSTNAAGIEKLLLSLNDDGATIVVVTHDGHLASIAKRMITLRDGKVVSDTTDATNVPSPSHLNLQPHHASASRLDRLRDRFLDSLASVAERGSKSLFNIAVIGLGIAGVVAGLGVSASASSDVTAIFNDAALDEVRIGTETTDPPVTKDDVASVLKIPGVRAAGLFYNVSDGRLTATRLPPTVSQTTRFSGTMIGCSAGTLAVLGVANSEDWEDLFENEEMATRLVLVGRSAADSLGISNASPGVQVWIEGVSYDVVGIVSGDRTHSNLDNSLIFPNAAVDRRLSPGLTPTLVIQTEPGLAHAVAQAVPITLDPTDPTRYTAQSTADLAELRTAVSASLGGWFLVIAAILLVVACLSTSSSLSAAVLYRRREIGLRRALGSSRASIAWLFMREGVIIGIVGGLVGCSVGVSTLVMMATLQGWALSLSWLQITAGVALGGLTGAISSVGGAIRGARLAPAQALRE
ncbi:MULTISPECIES: ATP-binding cassette domain-containing protein [Microbacterium]|uniref:ABC transporter ATP-binding protein/permease n=1 Tax=Microbacterium TaxID=33882 RepID=UPI0027826F14|nr:MULTISPECIES: ABC transporter ATP-binding protein/permease [Microbacterium]MDQ1084700.1 macrolide transport system ATP-binding/permease protein [Microbacterium sp. SORGH_AS_0344]MDQ1170023.1 macrolide transport system ATP-binding/permease protein [Microbacterium proteolyticum]